MGVPLYGVGGPKGTIEPFRSDTCVDASSPFYGWDSDMFYLFEHTAQPPELLLISTGQKMYPLPPNLQSYIKSLGIQFEVLNTVF